MDAWGLCVLIAVAVIGAIAVWRDPHAAAQVILDILTQFSNRKKPNDIKRNDEDGDRD